MKNVKLFFIFYLCVFYSCKHVSSVDKENAELAPINIDINQIKGASEYFFDDYNLIALETNDDCLLENITKTVFVGDQIYILTSYGGNIYKFDSDGHYISKMKQGNGPGELVFVTDFYVDAENERIFVLDVYRTIKEYTLSGDYIKEQGFESPFFSLCVKKQGIFLFEPNLSKSSSHYLSIYPTQGEPRKALPKDDNFKQAGFMSTNVFVDNDEKSMYVSHMLSDTIYTFFYDSGVLSPAYFIDFHGLSINSKNIKIDNSRMHDEIVKKNGYISGKNRLTKLGDHLFFFFEYKDNVYYVAYNKKTKKTELFSRLLQDLPNPSRIVGANNEGAVGMYTMIDLKDYFESNQSVEKRTDMLKQLSSDSESNPILIVLKKR